METDRLLLTVLEVVATLVFALAGIIEAARKRLDVVGVAVVAFVTAFGGGTLRDVLLDKRPFFWVEHDGYVWLVLAAALLAMPVLRQTHLRPTERAIRVPDAAGLGLFAVLGTSQAAALGMPLIVAAIMGVITGVFGGVLRDVLCNEIPTVFRDRQPYALCAFAGAWTFLALDRLGIAALLALGAGAAVAAGLRLLALARDWQVPGWRDPST